jgi:hypothetical protein
MDDLVFDNEVYYAKMVAEGRRRLLPVEAKIWGLMPHDPASEYQQLETAYLESWSDISPELIRWFVGRIFASYDEHRHDAGAERFRQCVAEFRERSGSELRRMIDEGAHVLVNVDHQSRFSPLIAALLVQLAVADTDDEAVALRSICSTIYSRYIGFYELKVGEILGNSEIPARPALDIARNFCGLIPVFPNTDIRDSCEIDATIQRRHNKRVMAAARPPRGEAHVRVVAASAAIDVEDHGWSRMRTVGEGTKASLEFEHWDYTMAIATHIDRNDPMNSFFVPSPIERGYDRTTFDRQNRWIAEERSARTGSEVVYAAGAD